MGVLAGRKPLDNELPKSEDVVEGGNKPSSPSIDAISYGIQAERVETLPMGATFDTSPVIPVLLHRCSHDGHGSPAPSTTSNDSSSSMDVHINGFSTELSCTRGRSGREASRVESYEIPRPLSPGTRADEIISKWGPPEISVYPPDLDLDSHEQVDPVPVYSSTADALLEINFGDAPGGYIRQGQLGGPIVVNRIRSHEGSETKASIAESHQTSGSYPIDTTESGTPDSGNKQQSPDHIYKSIGMPKRQESRPEAFPGAVPTLAVSVALDRCNSSDLGKLNGASAKGDVGLEGRLLSSIAHQMPLVKPSQIWTTSDPQWSVSNYLKGVIEDFCGESWIWWPLKQRREKIPVGKTRLHWMCGCGRERFVDVPNEFATQVIQMATGETSFSPGATVARPPPTYTSSRTASNNDNNTRRANIPNQSNSQDQSSIQLQSISQHHPNPDRPQETHVFFVVASGPKIGDKHRLAQKKIDAGTSTDDLFEWLQEKYFELRGFFRSSLSIRVYSHCDFYMFHKWDADMYGPAEQNSFPDPSLPYYYLPKPMSPIPPITEDQFYHRFYACYKPTTFHRLFHKCRTRCTDCVTLNRLPLRQHPLQVEDAKDEYFWGIYAVTRIAFTRVLAYSILCFAPAIFPGVVFFFLWLFPWGHEADLQNAAVPLGLSLTLLTLLLSFVAWDALSSRWTSGRTKARD